MSRALLIALSEFERRAEFFTRSLQQDIIMASTPEVMYLLPGKYLTTLALETSSDADRIKAYDVRLLLLAFADARGEEELKQWIVYSSEKDFSGENATLQKKPACCEDRETSTCEDHILKDDCVFDWMNNSNNFAKLRDDEEDGDILTTDMIIVAEELQKLRGSELNGEHGLVIPFNIPSASLLGLQWTEFEEPKAVDDFDTALFNTLQCLHLSIVAETEKNAGEPLIVKTKPKAETSQSKGVSIKLEDGSEFHFSSGSGKKRKRTIEVTEHEDHDDARIFRMTLG